MGIDECAGSVHSLGEMLACEEVLEGARRRGSGKEEEIKNERMFDGNRGRRKVMRLKDGGWDSQKERVMERVSI